MPLVGPTGRQARYPASSATPNVPQDIQNLATDLTTALPGPWVTSQISAPDYSATPSALNQWQSMPGFTSFTTAVVTTGRELEVEAAIPVVNAGGGFFYIRLMINNVERDRQLVSAAWAPMKLTSRITGTGATANLRLEFQSTAADGNAQAVGGNLRLQYRIN
jgi:hypothetical protein